MRERKTASREKERKTKNDVKEGRFIRREGGKMRESVEECEKQM